MKLYQKLAQLVVAYQNCEKSGNTEWRERHAETIQRLCEEYMPRGAGLDGAGAGQLQLADESGWPLSSGEELLFKADFHHMDEHGYYDGWSNHLVKVRPSLAFGFVLRVTGENRNDIKSYIADCFHEALNREVK